jgi:uncharacterized protein YjbI with pentapeptide repeats
MSSQEPRQKRPFDLFGRSDLPTEGQSWWRVLVPGRKLRWGSGGLILVAVLLTLLVLAVFFVPNLLVRRPVGLSELTGNQRVQAEILLAQARNSVRTTLVQALGGGIVLFTLGVGLGQLLVARQGQLVDRFTKTIQQLGADAVDVRLGAIFALQQIAERPEYARPVTEILLAYLKTHATDQTEGDRKDSPQTSPVASGASSGTGRARLQPDLQAALRILVVDGLWVRVMRGRRLDLSFIDVRYADLPDADFSGVVLLGAVLDGSNLTGARMMSADMRRISLKDADLTDADLTGADLTGAIVRHAKLDRAKLGSALLESADLTGETSLKLADLTLADATKADLSDAKLNGAHLDYAVLIGTVLKGSILSGATMQRVRFDSATNLTSAKMDKVVMDEETKMRMIKMFPGLNIGTLF